MKIAASLPCSPATLALLDKPAFFQYDSNSHLADHEALEEDCIIATRRAPNGSFFIGRVRGTEVSIKQGIPGKPVGSQPYGLDAFSKGLGRNGDGSIAVFRGTTQQLDELFANITIEPQASKLATSFDQPKVLLPGQVPTIA